MGAYCIDWITAKLMGEGQVAELFKALLLKERINQNQKILGLSSGMGNLGSKLTSHNDQDDL